MKWINKSIVWILPVFPKKLIWVFSKRYIAGRTLEDALECSRKLNEAGAKSTIDVLGEEITTAAQAEENRQLDFTVIDAVKYQDFDAGLSVKLTALGLRQDSELCYRNVRNIVAKAAESGVFVRIDMEDSSATAKTLEIYRRLRQEYSNVGAVIQAYLKRSEEDVARLIREKTANIRLCKGIYNESPRIAYKDPEKIRENFILLMSMILNSGEKAAIATHDNVLLEEACSQIRNSRIRSSRYEFQMLLGVTEKKRQELIQEGHAMRVYVPFGEHWYGYSLRRLKENPKMAGYIIKNLFVRG